MILLYLPLHQRLPNPPPSIGKPVLQLLFIDPCRRHQLRLVLCRRVRMRKVLRRQQPPLQRRHRPARELTAGFACFLAPATAAAGRTCSPSSSSSKAFILLILLVVEMMLSRATVATAATIATLPPRARRTLSTRPFPSSPAPSTAQAAVGSHAHQPFLPPTLPQRMLPSILPSASSSLSLQHQRPL